MADRVEFSISDGTRACLARKLTKLGSTHTADEVEQALAQMVADFARARDYFSTPGRTRLRNLLVNIRKAIAPLDRELRRELDGVPAGQKNALRRLAGWVALSADVELLQAMPASPRSGRPASIDHRSVAVIVLVRLARFGITPSKGTGKEDATAAVLEEAYAALRMSVSDTSRYRAEAVDQIRRTAAELWEEKNGPLTLRDFRGDGDAAARAASFYDDVGHSGLRPPKTRSKKR